MVRTLEFSVRVRPSPLKETASQSLQEDSQSQQLESLDAKELGPSHVKNIMTDPRSSNYEIIIIFYKISLPMFLVVMIG